MPDATHGTRQDAHVDDWRDHGWERSTDKGAHVREWERHVRDSRLQRDAHLIEWRRHVREALAPRDAHVTRWRAHHEARRRRAFASRFAPRGERLVPHALGFLRDAPSRSFVMGVAGGRPLVLSWSPGRLSIDGDAGRLSIVGHYETASLEAALRWASTAEVDYLLGKSGETKEVDHDASARDLVERLNEPAFEALRGITEESRDARRAHAEDEEAHEALVASGEATPEDAPTGDGLRMSEGYLRISAPPAPHGRPPLEDAPGHGVPDGFGPWHAAWRALEARSMTRAGPEAILTAAGRRPLRLAIARLCHGGDGEAWFDFVCDVFGDAEDAYVRAWYPRQRLMAGALRDACRIALDRLAEEAARPAPTDLVATVRAHCAAIADDAPLRDDLAYLRDEADELGDEIDLLDAGRSTGADGVAGEAVDVAVAALNIVFKAAPGMTDEDVVAYADRKCRKWRDKLAAGAYGARATA